MFKKLLLFSLFFLVLFSCSTNKLSKQSEGYIPEDPSLKNIYFGMSQREFLSITDQNKIAITDSTSYNFRTVYAVKTGQKDLINIVYYFDMDKNRPLYEIIMEYSSEEKSKEIGEELLGNRNHKENTEWFFERDDSFSIKAWNFKKKLVVTALIEDTEWYDEVYKK